MDIESFLNGGANEEFDPISQPKDTYRGSHNMDLVSLGGNSFALKSSTGTLLSFTISPGFVPIGWTFLQDDLIIASANVAVDGTGKLGRVTFDTSGNGTYVEKYSNAGLKWGWNYPMRKMIASKENEFIERIYWTNKYTPPGVINIADPDVATLNVSSLDWVPLKKIGEITFIKQGSTDGLLQDGVYQYCYRLRTKTGVITSWSYLSKEINVLDDIPITAPERSYQIHQGGNSTIRSSKSNVIEISNIDQAYDYIDVAATYCPSLGVVGVATIFSKSLITGTVMQFTHKGNEDLGTITNSELIAIATGLLSVGDFDTNKNRMFIADLVTTGDPGGFDASVGVTIVPEEYLYPCDMSGPIDSADSAMGPNCNQLVGHERAVIPVVSGTILPDGIYEVYQDTSGDFSAEFVTYGTTNYFVGDIFTGVYGTTTYAATDIHLQIRAVVSIKQYTKAGGGDVRKNIAIDNDFYDMKGVAMSHYIKSLWRGEPYRYGVLVFDLIGSPWFVRWIGDITMPEQFDTTHGIDPRLCERKADGICSLRALGIRVSGLDLTDVIDQISGFSIVRAPRDGQIVAQGICFTTSFEAPNIRPMAGVSVLQDWYLNSVAPASAYYSLYSPDLLFSGFVTTPWQIGDKVKLVDWLDRSDSNDISIDLGTQDTPTYHGAHKYYKQSTVQPVGTASRQKGWQEKLIYSLGLNEATDISGPLFNPYDTGINYIGNTKIAVSAWSGRISANSKQQMLYTETATGLYCGHPDTSEKCIVNVIRPNSNPYGGQSDNAKANTLYMYSGHYQKIDAGVKADVLSGGRYIFNNIQVFGGDCFVNVFDIQRQIKFNNPSDNNQYSHSIMFPIESKINTALRVGRHVAKDRSAEPTTGINTNGVGRDGFGMHPEAFGVNDYEDAYSQDVSPILYPALPVIGTQVNRLINGGEAIVRWSPVKHNGEIVDNFRVFNPDDFKQLEGRWGRIENLVLDADMLFYLQQHSVGYLPVNETALISSTTLNPTTLGTGGIIERYDQKSIHYGNQHHFSVFKVEKGFGWFDMRRRALCTMRITSEGVANISVAKGFRPLLQRNLSSGEIITSDNPFISKGISAFFDAQTNKIYMVFANGTQGTFVIKYDFELDIYIGTSSVRPPNGLNCHNFLLLQNPIKPAIQATHAYVIGDEITGYSDPTLAAAALTALNTAITGGDGPTIAAAQIVYNDSLQHKHYICILAYTSAGTPVIPQLDTTHWHAVNSLSDIHIANVGNVCKFFGIVYDNNVEVIINPDRKDKIFDNIELIGNDIESYNPFTTYSFRNSYQTGADTNLDSVPNRDYRWINRKWFSNIPFVNKQRMTDTWLGIKLIKDNKLSGDLFTSKNLITKIVSLITSFRHIK